MTKGYYESSDYTGKAPKHVAASNKKELEDTSRNSFMIPLNEYEKQGYDFLLNNNIHFSAIKKDNACPPWEDGKHIHGNKYIITLSRPGKKYRFSFWNSLNDKQKGIVPTPYQVLSSITKNDPGDIDDFISEFGYDKYQEDVYGKMKPNKQTNKIYNAVLKEWQSVSEFFSDNELEQLREIN